MARVWTAERRAKFLRTINRKKRAVKTGVKPVQPITCNFCPCCGLELRGIVIVKVNGSQT